MCKGRNLTIGGWICDAGMQTLMFRICSQLLALNVLDPMACRIDNRDSTLHLAAVWLRCIDRRLIEGPADVKAARCYSFTTASAFVC